MEKVKNSQIIIKEQKDGVITIISKNDEGVSTYNLFVNKNIDFKQKFKSKITGIKGNVVVGALITTILIAANIYGINKVIDFKEKKNDEELEETRIKNNLSYNIDNEDISIVREFLDEVLYDLAEVKDNNLEASNAYKAMYNELILAETTNEYAFHIKEGAKQASIANIYFGVGKYKKYLNAKRSNGEIYFPFVDALPTYSLEEVAGVLVITYLPYDNTPYVSVKELEDFNKSQEIKAYINSL